MLKEWEADIGITIGSFKHTPVLYHDGEKELFGRICVSESSSGGSVKRPAPPSTFCSSPPIGVSIPTI
jgi:hypothetical protein